MNLLKTLLEEYRSVLNYFDQQQLNHEKQLRWKSREKLIMMPIDMFLSLAKPGKSEYKNERVAQMIKDNEKFDIPYLNIDINGSVAKVTGHEGRHRARALEELGYKSIPVLLRTSNLRWSEQDDSSKFDYKEIWPSTIVSETGSKQFKFPISRQQSGQDFEQI